MTGRQMNELLDESKEQLRKIIKEGGAMQVAEMVANVLKEEAVNSITLTFMIGKMRTILDF